MIVEDHNVAVEHREKAINKIATWYVVAGKYKVLPIDGSALQRVASERPRLAKDRTS